MSHAVFLAAAVHSAPAVCNPAKSVCVPYIRYLAIMPEIILLGGAVLLLAVASLVRRPMRAKVATAGTIAIAGTSLGFSLWQWFDVQSHGPYTAIDHALVIDGFSVLVNVLVSITMLLSALASDGYLRREKIEGPEYHVLALVSASGAMMMGAANDLIVVFLGLEILSIALYVLAAFNHKRAASGEAALKYFILGSFSSAIFVYGIALTYGGTGSTNLTQIADFLAHNVVVNDGILLAGLSLLLVGFAFKVAAVPFHMWTPDVYQGSPSPVVGFMAAVAKVGGFAALLRVFISSFGLLQADWRPIVYAMALVTLALGAVLAVVQRDVKRMLAYSSINHAGFVLLGLQAASAQGVSSALYYLFAYTFMVIGTFAVVTVMGGDGDASHDIAGYRGLARRQPLLALSLAVLLLAQAGAPFTTGFLAKFQVVDAAVNAHSVPLAVVAMVSAAIAAFFYLRVAVVMYTPRHRPGALAGQESANAGDALVIGQTLDVATLEPPVRGSGPSTGSTNAGATDEPAPTWAGTDRSVAVVERLNARLILDEELVTGESVSGGDVDRETEPAKVAVPVTAAIAIGLCVGVTVVFGIIPAPLIDFAHKATLLFLP